ncbi:DUF202 domain-containing protein [Aquipuribacter hungaricus]|uniref:DUF202 domain-containing protein n=2 Tax=Aquipuribacter hungaricus TaxID=545624 RepID=A0ABV7WM44_9MICO
MTGHLLDAGLQPERTRLAWRRTTLAVLTGAALSARLLPEVLGPAGMVLALVALAGAGALAVLADRRSRQVVRALRDGGPPPGAGALALLAGGTSAAAAVAAVGVLVHAAG